ncbi:MAG TPA: DinB family protein [Gemmatimonadales bacterium]
MSGIPVSGSPDQELIPAEIELALGYLEEGAKGVAQAVQGLSEEQWVYRSAPGRWSIAEILEHLALLEELFGTTIVSRLDDGSAAPANRPPAVEDARLRALVSDRSVSVVAAGRASLAKAPRSITPTGAWSPEESLQRFRAGRVRTAEFLRRSTGLRRRWMEHPALGTLDGYQWVLFVAAHSVRHTKQILELQSEPGFPGRERGYFAEPSETAEFSVES